jgi:capsular polysaccharide biosynthesis protein
VVYKHPISIDQDACCLDEYHQIPIENFKSSYRTEDINCYLVNNVRLHGLTGPMGLVGVGTLLQSQPPGPDRDNICHSVELHRQNVMNKPVRLCGQYAIATHASFRNYFHYHVDVLSNILFFKKIKKLIKYNRIRLILPVLSGWQVKAMSHLKVDADDIIFLNDLDCYYEITKALILPYYSPRNLLMDPYVSNVFRKIKENLAQSYQSNRKCRVYISRANVTTRKIVNERALFNLLSRYGFIFFNSDDYEYNEAVRLFSDAEIIVGPHGAGLTNAGFMSPGGRVVEILTIPIPLPYFNHLSHISRLAYYPYLPLISDKFIEENIVLDLNRFAKFLEKIIF